jgi:hypothetical protein
MSSLFCRLADDYKCRWHRTAAPHTGNVSSVDHQSVFRSTIDLQSVIFESGAVDASASDPRYSKKSAGQTRNPSSGLFDTDQNAKSPSFKIG